MAEFELIPGYSQILNNSIAACRAIFDSDEQGTYLYAYTYYSIYAYIYIYKHKGIKAYKSI
jgi:hypothetical protein